MPPRLIALDLDGTLLDARHELTPRAHGAIRRCAQAGALVALCTGRPPRMTRAFAETLELEYSIVYNGASRYQRSTAACIHHHQLARPEAEEVIWCIREGVPGALLGIETSAGWFTDAALFDDARERLLAARLPLPDGVGPVESFLAHGAIKIFARHPEHAPAAMAKSVRDLAVYATWSGPGLLEVMHERVNKADALERLAHEHGIARADVAAFGDNHNDVQMLAWAGHGVAPANASSEAQDAADEVTSHHDEDGIAEVLERWFA